MPAVGEPTAWTAALTGWSAAALALAGYGAYASFTSPKRLFFSLAPLAVAAFAAATLLGGAPAACRMAVEPLVALVAAVGIDALRRNWRRRRSGLELVRGTR